MGGAVVTTIAACLIARNSAETLERLLVSVRPFVDEVCVWLGGESTDGTPAILERLAAEPGCPIHVEQGSWRNDYAWARNQSYAMASSSHLMWFDDDEILEGGAELRELVERDDPDMTLVRRCEVMHRDRVHSPLRQRIFAARTSPEWESPIHERPALPVWPWGPVSVAHPGRVRVIHHPLKSPNRHMHRAAIEATIARGEFVPWLSPYAADYLLAERDYAGAIEVLERGVDAAFPDVDERDIPALSSGLLALEQCRTKLLDVAGALEAREQRRALYADREFPPFTRLAPRLVRENPILPDDPLWAMYADDPRTSPPYSWIEAKPPGVAA